jgi:hypothetical protein
MTAALHIGRLGKRARAALPLVLLALLCSPPATAGIYHYPWCETIRDRCFAKAAVRKAECNWRYAYAKSHVINGLSKWPKGTANYCYLYRDGA